MGTSTSKAGRRRPIQIDALAGGNLSLTAQWQMVGIYLDTTLPFAIPSASLWRLATLRHQQNFLPVLFYRSRPSGILQLL